MYKNQGALNDFGVARQPVETPGSLCDGPRNTLAQTVIFILLFLYGNKQHIVCVLVSFRGAYGACTFYYLWTEPS